MYYAVYPLRNGHSISIIKTCSATLLRESLYSIIYFSHIHLEKPHSNKLEASCAQRQKAVNDPNLYYMRELAVLSVSDSAKVLSVDK